MAYTNLINAISAVVKTNGNGVITGQNMQDVLKSIINTIGANATFAGIATPSTIPPTTATNANVFYLATQNGTYSNFGGIVVADEVVILSNTSGSWAKIATNISNDDLSKAMISIAQIDDITHQGTYSGAVTIKNYILKYNRDGKMRFVGTTSAQARITLQVFETQSIFHNINQIFVNGDFDVVIDLGAWLKNNQYADGDNIDKVVITFTSATAWQSDTITISNVYSSINIANYFFSQNELKNFAPLADDVLLLKSKMDVVYKPIEGDYNGYLEVETQRFFDASHENNVCYTTKNSAAEKAGILQKIKIYANPGGRCKFAIGLLDQRNWMVNPTFFDLNLTQGYNTYDVSAMGLVMPQGYQLFAYVRPYRDIQQPSAVLLGYVPVLDNVGIEKEMIYGRDTGPINRFLTANGARIYFAWQLADVSSIFALKSENEALKLRVTELNNIVEKQSFVYSDDGTPYKMNVVNGQINLKRQRFRNIFCIGNSLTNHGYMPSIGYYGDGWPMVATSEKTGWVELVRRIFAQKDATAEAHSANIALMERTPSNYLTDDAIAEILGGGITSDTDLVIYKGGENNGATPDYVAGLDAMINYIIRTYPQATILMTTGFWYSAYREMAHTEIAQKYNLSLLNIGTEIGNTRAMLGEYTYGRDNQEYPIINGGVANHVADVGFYNLANMIADFYGYEPLHELHNINIATTEDYIISRRVGVYQSLISILTKCTAEPSVTITSGAENIDATIHDMSSVVYQTTPNYVPTYVITFVMPNADVNVAIN